MSAPRATISLVMLGALTLVAGEPVRGQHEGDIAVGRATDDQLRCKPFEGVTPCFDPDLGVGAFAYHEPTQSCRSADPGFIANFSDDPVLDLYQLEDGAQIYLVAAEPMTPAFHVEYSGVETWGVGDDIPLGSYIVHRHVRFVVDMTDRRSAPCARCGGGTWLGRRGRDPAVPHDECSSWRRASQFAPAWSAQVNPVSGLAAPRCASGQRSGTV